MQANVLSITGDQVARFLETQGLKEEALQIATDPDYRFELAIQLKKLDEASKVYIPSIDLTNGFIPCVNNCCGP